MTSQEKAKNSVLPGEETEFEPKFLHRLVEEGIEQNHAANDVVFIYQDDGIPKRKTTYSVFNQNANQIAQVILDTIQMSSLRPNQEGDWIVAVCMNHSDNLVTTLLGVWKAGASYLPIDFSFPEHRIDHIINEAKPVLVIYDDSYPQPNFFNSIKSIKFGDLKRLSHRMPSDNIPNEQMLTKGDPNTKAITLYTSGSTGLPKGVRLRHHTFFHRILWQLQNFPYQETEKHCIFKTSLTFVDHIAELWCPIISGKSVVIVPKTILVNPELFVPVLEEYKIERLLGVPTLLRSVLMYLNMLESNKTKSMLSNLKLWFCSGETLTIKLAKEFFDYFDNRPYRLVNFYGCTEICGDVVWFELQSKQQLESLEKVPLGAPMPNMIVYVLDKDNKPVHEGEVGEICCAGVMVACGYINARNLEAFPRNTLDLDEPYSKMYRTGDYGYVRKGLLYFEGRRDTQIKIRGNRLDLSEVENNINELHYVSKAAILVYQAGQVDQALVAFIVTKNAITKTPYEIERDLRSRLTPYMMPQVFVIKEFPYMPNGKIDRQTLLKMYEEIAIRKKDKSEMELNFKDVTQDKLYLAQQVFEIIGGVLSNELRGKISVESNFFELGGNSLNTINTVTQLREQGYYIGLTDFIKARNLGDVLDKITMKNSKEEEMKIHFDTTHNMEPIDDLSKEECVDLIAKCFIHKSGMDQFLAGLKEEDYKEIIGGMWKKLVEQGHSFMVKDETGDIIGVSLNVDVVDEPEIKEVNTLRTIFDLLDSVEKPLLENRFKPAKGELLHDFMQGTSLKLTGEENIGVMGFMESQVIKMAKAKGFKGVFTTNSSPLTQQFGQSVFGFETLVESSVNKYVDKFGEKPFKRAPDHEKLYVMYKSLKN